MSAAAAGRPNTTSSEPRPPAESTTDHSANSLGISPVEPARTAPATAGSDSAAAGPVPAPFPGLKDAKVGRLVHPLDEGILCSFVGSFLVVALSLTLGICLTLVLLVLYPLAAAGRRVSVLCASSLRRLPLKRRLEVMANLVSPHDAQWLQMVEPDSAAPPPVHQALLMFDDQFQLEAVRRVVAAHLQHPSLARLSQRVVSFATGSAWLADDRFCVEQHIVSGPQLDGEGELAEFVGAEAARGLPLDRPPWQAVAVTVAGPPRRTGLLVRVHCVVSDGMGLLRALCHLLSEPATGPVPPRATFGSVTYSLNCVRALFVAPVTAAQWLLGCRPAAAGAGAAGASRTDVCLGGLSWEQVSQVKEVTHQSVQEILLSVVAGAVRSELKRAGLTTPPNLMVVMPVDLRRHEELCWRLRLSNTSCLSRLRLPCGTEGAVPRLWAARRLLDDLKTSADTAVSRLVTRAAYTLLPAGCARRLTQRCVLAPAGLLLANLAGPEAAIRVGGSSVTALYPLMTPPPSAWASVSVISYREALQVSVACRAQVGDNPARRVLLDMRRQLKILYNLLKHRRHNREIKRPLMTSDGTPAALHPTDELQEKLNLVQDQLHALRAAESAGQHVPQGDDGAADQFHRRVTALKEEFRDLLAELQRRRSTPDGSTVVYELDDLDGELRRAKKRPSSSRKMSTASSSSLSRPLSTAEPSKVSSSRSMMSCRSISSPGEAPRQLVARESGSTCHEQRRVELSPPVEVRS
ncbi:uncharacterized protein LOC122382508 [Amphibalanus amphitrite]|uniref:uncharacterized protein LOC122382508 n=1 Tax=Amphibalanus amphitrite TaxID=1232801 RepID=UPI001C92B77F|nr:uncharacterized protein LOC122382508 [Amphibalanus amphitrite]